MGNGIPAVVCRIGPDRLAAWCIVPKPVHVPMEPPIGPERIVRPWRSYTRHRALAHNAEPGLRAPGQPLRTPGCRDRHIRNGRRPTGAVKYIHVSCRGLICYNILFYWHLNFFRRLWIHWIISFGKHFKMLPVIKSIF